MEWFYVNDGQSTGPISDETLRELIQTGLIKPDTLLWNKSFGQEWKPAQSIPELFSTDSSLAPPPPSVTDPTPDTPNATIMSLARQSLTGNWGLFAGITFLLQLAQMGLQVLGIIPLLGGLVSIAWIIVSIPLYYGFQIMFLRVSRGVTMDFKNVFDGFQEFGRVWITTLWIWLFMFCWWLVAIIPIGIMAGLMMPIFSSANFIDGIPDPSVLLWILGFLIVVAIAILPPLIAWLSYSMSYFILHDNPNMKPYDAVRRSVFIMRGYRIKISYLYLRFTGWYILCILTCGIGFFWLIPYISMSKAHFYRTIKNRTNNKETPCAQ